MHGFWGLLSLIGSAPRALEMGIDTAEGHRGHVGPSLLRTEPSHGDFSTLTKNNNSIQKAVMYKIDVERLCPHIVPSQEA